MLNSPFLTQEKVAHCCSSSSPPNPCNVVLLISLCRRREGRWRWWPCPWRRPMLTPSPLTWLHRRAPSIPWTTAAITATPVHPPAHRGLRSSTRPRRRTSPSALAGGPRGRSRRRPSPLPMSFSRRGWSAPWCCHLVGLVVRHQQPLLWPWKQPWGERERGLSFLPSLLLLPRPGEGRSPSLHGEEEDGLRKSPSSSSASVKSGGSKKWKLKDLFLFRSASEGRATGRGSKDPLRSYTVLLPPSKRIDDSGSVGGGGAADPHEMYYSPNRAASEELKRKKKQTPLPYQHHGLFGCLRFNPAIHSIQKGFGGSSSSHKW